MSGESEVWSWIRERRAERYSETASEGFVEVAARDWR